MPPPREGMPLPWPFPWAKECPIIWSSIGGSYVLSESVDNEYIDLKITPVQKNGFNLVHVARYSKESELLSDGFALIAQNQRTIQLGLYPVKSATPSLWAMIKLHYQDSTSKCDKELVPILAMQSDADSARVPVEYRLIKIEKTE